MKDADSPELVITPELLLRAYAAGVFPMAECAQTDEIFWVDPRLRGILPLDGFHLPRSLRKRVLRGGYEVRVDHAFDAVVAACAARAETWISPQIEGLYGGLHRLGHAHSVEVWIDDRLAGGLYGVRLGAAFFGESMFSHARDASKIALVHLVARLRAGGFLLLDTQFTTAHLRQFGAFEIRRNRYHELLDVALRRPADFYRLAEDASADEVVGLVQPSTQTS